MTTIKLTPIGVNPEKCECCGEWIGASNALMKNSKGHAVCANALAIIQKIASSDKPDIEAILAITINAIGDRRE